MAKAPARKKKARFVPPSREVEVGDGVKITVTGLSLADIVTLTNRHLPKLRPLFEGAVDAKSDAEAANRVVMQAVATAPEAVVDAIQMATDLTKEEAEAVLQMPAALPVTILAEIVNATLVGGVALERMWGAVAQAMESLAPPAAGAVDVPPVQ